MSYTINKSTFKNKNEVTQKCRDIVNNNLNKVIEGDDLQYILDVLSHHPKYVSKMNNMLELYVDYDKLYNKNPCIFIRYKNDTVDDISYHYSIRHIPFSKNLKIDYIFKFGKYKGQSIYEIEDNQYIEWMSNLDNLDRSDKIKLRQFLRYGWIPYNPVAISKSKK